MYIFHPKEKIFIIFLLLLATATSIFLAMQQPKSKSNQKPENIPLPEEPQQLETRRLQVGGKIISVEVATTTAQLRQGLSGRDRLDPETGMYFELGQKKQATFWMSGMRFPIDIIWIDNQRVVGIEENAPIPARNTIPTFKSPTEVTNVLEVAAGFSQKNNLKIGDRITFYNERNEILKN